MREAATMTALEEKLRRLLERASAQADLAEVYFVARTSTPVEFENNRLKTIATAENAGVALRVVVGGRVGFSTGTKLDDLEEILAYALDSARYGGPAEFDLPGAGGLPGAGAGGLPEAGGPPGAGGMTEVFDEAVTRLTVEEMVALGEALLAPIRHYEPQIQAFAGIEREEARVILMNSNGFAGEYRATGFGLWTGGELVEGENMLWAYDGVGRGNLGDPRAEVARLTARVVEQFRLGRVNVPFRSGAATVIFSPRALGDLLQPLVACLDGKAVEKGYSPWKDKAGQTVAGDRVTLVDDGTLPFGPHTAPFDGEGTPCQRTPLIQEGRLENFYLDRRTARLLGRQPTGNGLRGLGSLPAPGTTNLILAGGDRPYADLLAGVQDGVLIEGLMGAWAGNPYSGEVQGNISLGFKIENGKPVGRIKDCLVAANAFDAFSRQLVAFSQEQEWSGASLLPYALFEGITLSAKG